MAPETPKTYLGGSVAAEIAARESNTISWRAIFAGTLIALLSYMILMSLGLAIGGSAIQGAIQGGTDIGAVGIGSGIWLAVSVIVSLFLGSFFAARVSGLVFNRIGRVQGAVITALFFGIMLSQVGAAIGMVGRGVGQVAGAAGSAIGDIAQNPEVRATVNRAIGDLNLQSPPDQVAQNLGVLLLRGQTSEARDYLSQQAGITPQEADRRLEQLQADVEQVAMDVGNRAARVVQAAGWALFFSLLLGTIAGVLGGGLGAAANLKKPIGRADERAFERAA